MQEANPMVSGSADYRNASQLLRW